VLLVVPLSDGATVGRGSFPVSHRYVEILWTPLLGPTQVILLRRLAEVAESEAGRVNPAELAVAIGALPRGDGRVGRRSPLDKAIARLARFRMAAWRPRCTLAVATRVPVLGERDLRRLPDSLRDLHNRFVDELKRPT